MTTWAIFKDGKMTVFKEGRWFAFGHSALQSDVPVDLPVMIDGVRRILENLEGAADESDKARAADLASRCECAPGFSFPMGSRCGNCGRKCFG